MAEKAYKVGNDIFDISDKDVELFLKDYPTAVEIESYTVGQDTFDIPINERELFLKDFPTAQPIKKKVETISEDSGEPSQTSSTEQPQSSFKKTQLSPQEESQFQAWMGNEPDRDTYDYRGFYSAEKESGTLKPTISDYVKEDPNFHFYSIGLDGKILKSPTHETYNKTVEAEEKLGNEIYTDKEGILRSRPKQPQLATEKPKEARPLLDAVRSLSAGSLKALGGISGAPSFFNKTITGMAVRPIVRAMGGTDEDANLAMANILLSNPASAGAVRGEEAQRSLIEKANKIEEKMRPIEGDIWKNVTQGNWGNAGELLMRGLMSSVPYFAMTAATAGGGAVATLGTIGATASAQQYGELEGQKESKRILNAWLYGGFEAAGELVTAGIVRGIGRSFKGIPKKIDESFVKGAAKEIAKTFGLEGSSEALTQIGQNFTDIVTGVDDQKNILSGVLDAFLIGGVSGGGLGTLGTVGRFLASDKHIEAVQENFKQQEVLINQIEQTDSDPVKEALKRNIKDLRVEADEIMAENYALAKQLSPEQRDQVANLYSVWNEIQDKIDSGKLSEQEVKALTKTVDGIKGQIQTIKDDLITKLEEEKAAKEAEKAKKTEGKEGAEKRLKETTTALEDLIKEEMKPEKVEPAKVEEPITEEKAEVEEPVQKVTTESVQELSQPTIKQENIEDYPNYQDNIRTPITQKILDYFAESVGIEKYREDLSTGKYISWLQGNDNLGYRISEILNSPRRAIELINEFNKDKSKQEIGGKEDAERVREEIEKPSEQKAPELVKGEEERLDLRNAPQDRVEAEQREEVTPAKVTEPTVEEKGEPAPKTKSEQLKVKEEEVKNRLANNIEGLMGAIGGITEITGDKRESVLKYLSNIIKDLAELTALKGEQLFQRFKDYLTENKITLPDDIIQEAFDKYEGKPKVEKQTKKEDTKFRKTQINSLIQDETAQQQEIAKIVTEKRERYTVLHQADAVQQAQDFIGKVGLQEAKDDLKGETKQMIDFPMRQVARLILLDFYSRAIIDNNSSESDKGVAFRAIDDLQSITAREATKAGQGNAMLQVWKAMQPLGLLEYVARKIEKSNQKILDKKIEDTTLGQQLDELYDTLSRESKNIIKDILAGKGIAMPKEPTVPKEKPIPPRKTVPRERIKKEQEYRKDLLDKYRKSEKPLAMAVTGLTSSQIELGGNLVASYIREGVYRMQEIVENLMRDFKSIDVTLDGDKIGEILERPKSTKESYAGYIERMESKARIRAGKKLVNKRINDVLIEHWSEKDELKRTLAQKLVDEAGLTEAEANKLEKEILAKFDEEILKRSQEKLTKILGTQKLPTEKKAKGVVGKMIDLINLGTLDEDLYRQLFAEKFKLIKLTDQHKEKILRLADNVQMASGRGWIERDATIRLAKYIFELYPESQRGEIFDTWLSLAYANMLFGPTTSILNMWSAGWNLTLKPVRDVVNLSKWHKLLKDGKKGEADIYNPFGEMFYVPMINGSSIGTDLAREVYINGDLNNKYIEDVAKKGQFRVTPLERDKYGKSKRFKPVSVKIGGRTFDLNIFNAYKYSGRNLAAQDKFMLATSYEVELAHILRDNLKNQNLKGRELTREVMAYIRAERVDADKIDKTLADDIALYKKLNGEDMTPLQQKIRRRELILDELPISKEEKEEAEKIARGNIFTDERGGAIATVSYAIGRAASRGHLPAFFIKAFIPFTHVVGNVAEYMMDHVPFYGFLRANGMSPSMIKRMSDPSNITAQLGDKGSRLYYEQMGRAWLGTMSFMALAIMGLGHDDDDFFEITGGYSQEGFKKSGRENVTPPYTLRIGNVKIPYKNIPSLAIPCAIIGNINDALKAKQDEGDIMERLTVAMMISSAFNTLFMFKDMAFLDGAQRLSQIVADVASTEESKVEPVVKETIKSYLGLVTRPLPQNNNAIQQIWKIFDPVSYPQNSIKNMLAYAGGVQHFLNYPKVDQLGDIVKTYPGETLLPYTHWLGIEGKDERWKFLAKYNAIPNKIYNRTMQIEAKEGIEKRQLDENELYDLTKRAGELFSNSLKAYMSNTDKVEERAKVIIEREKSNGDIEKLNGIKEDVEKLFSTARERAEVELFRWGSVKEDMPQVWNLIKKYQAYFPYQKTGSTEGIAWDDSDLYDFNNNATVLYAERIKDYLSSGDAKIKADKESGAFEKKITKAWEVSKGDAKSKKDREVKVKNRATKK